MLIQTKFTDKTVKQKCGRIGMHHDGGGLYLAVKSADACSWVYRYQLDGRPHEIGLGAYCPTGGGVSLSRARELAAQYRTLKAEGIDPLKDREDRRAAAKAEAAKAITFKDAAERYIEAKKGEWKNAKHAWQWTATLKAFVYPKFGNRPVAEIGRADVLNALNPIWTEKAETASRVRGRIETVLDWATAAGYRTGDNPARWKGHLSHLLAKRSKVQKVVHHAALPYAEIGAFVIELRAREGVSAQCLEFVILTAVRTGEAIGAKWDEIDFRNAVWTIPAARMKADKEHRVPLSEPAMHILRELQKSANGSAFVFHSSDAGKPISNMAMLQTLRRMDHADLTVHGFRSTFRDWAAEQTNFPREIAESALAHSVRDKTEAAYKRGDVLKKRRLLMDAWARFSGAPAIEGKILPMRAAG